MRTSRRTARRHGLTRIRPVFASALFVAAALSLAACGSDSDPDAATEPGTTAPAETDDAAVDAEPAGADTEAYCAASLALETDPGPDVDFPTATDEEIATALKAYAAGPLEELFGAVEETAPPELDEAAQTVRGAIDEIAETGDPSAFEQPEVAAAEETAHAYDLEHCGWTQVELTTTDYAFGGLEDTYEAGPTSFELENAGKEVHEMVVARINDDVDLSVDELLALPEGEVDAMIEMKGLVEPVAPGETGNAVFDLEPGRHVVLCFLPEGATDFPTMEQLGPDARPHAAMGMIQEITVT